MYGSAPCFTSTRGRQARCDFALAWNSPRRRHQGVNPIRRWYRESESPVESQPCGVVREIHGYIAAGGVLIIDRGWAKKDIVDKVGEKVSERCTGERIRRIMVTRLDARPGGPRPERGEGPPQRLSIALGHRDGVEVTLGARGADKGGRGMSRGEAALTAVRPRLVSCIF